MDSVSDCPGVKFATSRPEQRSWSDAQTNSVNVSLLKIGMLGSMEPVTLSKDLKAKYAVAFDWFIDLRCHACLRIYNLYLRITYGK